MRRILLAIQSIIFFTVFNSCISKSNIDLDVPVQQKDLIVECYLTPNRTAELSLTESNTFDEELVLRILGNARANVITDTGAIQLKNIAVKSSDRHVIVNYSGKDTIKNNHSFFNLDITSHKGVKLQASTNVVSQVQIKKLEVAGNAFSAYHNIVNVDDKYFRLVASIYKDGEYDQTRYELYNQNNSEANSCTFQWQDLKKEADSVVVTLYHIQKDYYDYLQSIRNATSAYRDPFLTPEVIKSNIKGGLGIFTYYTFDRRGISF